MARESKKETLSNYPERQLIWIDGQLKKGNTIFSSPTHGLKRWEEFNLYPSINGKTREVIPFHHQNIFDVQSFVQSSLSDAAITRLVNNIRIWRTRSKGGLKNDDYTLQVKLSSKSKGSLDELCKRFDLNKTKVIEKLINDRI